MCVCVYAPTNRTHGATVCVCAHFALTRATAELLNFAKTMQRKVKGQPPEIADAMYTKAVELYRCGRPFIVA